MRARRVLAIVIATPVLLATIGMTGASAATWQKPPIGKPAPQPGPPAADSTDGKADRIADDEPEEGLLNTLAGELLNRVSPAREKGAGASGRS
ncbi:hypothetical protein Scel_33700 [Streptomyces cellostaticus]|nr:hypothetical protein Scel_33700 [Streptomyces cellostaticus]